MRNLQYKQRIAEVRHPTLVIGQVRGAWSTDIAQRNGKGPGLGDKLPEFQYLLCCLLDLWSTNYWTSLNILSFIISEMGKNWQMPLMRVIQQRFLKWHLDAKLTMDMDRNKFTNSWTRCDYQVPIAQVGKDIVKEMALEKFLKMVQAVGSEEGEWHVPGITWAEMQGVHELSNFKGLRGNLWQGWRVGVVRYKTEHRA